MNHFVLDGGCPFFEWQDTYAANLGHHQQVAQGIHLVPQRRSSTNPMPPQSTIVPFSCGRPRELHPPSRFYKGILYRPCRRPLRSKQLIRRPLSRLLLDQSFVAHNPVRPKPLHSLSSLRRAQLAHLTWRLSACSSLSLTCWPLLLGVVLVMTVVTRQ